MGISKKPSRSEYLETQREAYDSFCEEVASLDKKFAHARDGRAKPTLDLLQSALVTMQYDLLEAGRSFEDFQQGRGVMIRRTGVTAEFACVEGEEVKFITAKEAAASIQNGIAREMFEKITTALDELNAAKFSALWPDVKQFAAHLEENGGLPKLASAAAARPVTEISRLDNSPPLTPAPKRQRKLGGREAA
jgi:hypothetical protein